MKQVFILFKNAEHAEGLGHNMVGKIKLSLHGGKVDEILQARRPGNRKELRSFMGKVGYYREYIQDF